MIKVEMIEKRKYSIQRDGREILKSILVFTPATNKFDRIASFIESASEKLGEEFDNWFEEYLTSYVNSKCDVTVLKSHIPNIKKWCDKYLELVNVKFENYVNKEKASKSSIFFDAEEIEKLIKVSNYLKLYFIICQDIYLKLPANYHKEIYNELVSLISNCEIVFKLYKLVSSKTHRYSLSDKTMWNFIRIIYCKTTDMHINSIFNSLLNYILVTCDTESNPIPYFSSVIDQSIRWILCGVYKDSIIYSDSISTEDIHTIPGKDNFLSYCYNDTIGKLVSLATNYLEEVGITDIPKFNSTVSKIKEFSLVSMYITYPIISKIFDIPYRYLRPIQIEHSYLLNILVYYYLPEELKEKFPIITKLLLHYNNQKCIVKTTYKLKNSSLFLQTFSNFMNFKNRVLPALLYSDFIGKLSRNEYISFISERKIANFPLVKLEEDIILFYNMFFSGQLKKYFDEMKQKIESQL